MHRPTDPRREPVTERDLDGAPQVTLRERGGRRGALDERLDRFVADARVDAAARTRSRERWLRRQAEEETTLAGVLADLRDQATAVEVHTRGGGRYRAVVRALGADHVVLADAHGRGQVLVPLAALRSVRTSPGVTPVLGDRTTFGAALLTDAFAELADERAEIRVVTDGVDVAAGTVRSVGQDVVVVASREAPAVVVYVPLDAISAVVVDG
jgi:hypothetical protein